MRGRKKRGLYHEDGCFFTSTCRDCPKSPGAYDKNAVVDDGRKIDAVAGTLAALETQKILVVEVGATESLTTVDLLSTSLDCLGVQCQVVQHSGLVKGNGAEILEFCQEVVGGGYSAIVFVGDGSLRQSYSDFMGLIKKGHEEVPAIAATDLYEPGSAIVFNQSGAAEDGDWLVRSINK